MHVRAVLSVQIGSGMRRNKKVPVHKETSLSSIGVWRVWFLEGSACFKHSNYSVNFFKKVKYLH